MKSILALRHVPYEDLGTLAGALRNADLEVQMVDLFARTPDALPLDRAAGLVVMGRPMNVDETDEFPFLAAEVKWIQEAVRRRT